MTLKERYEAVCEEYVDEFVKKQGLDTYYWIGGNVGGVIDFNECYTFDFDDIRTDIDFDVEKGVILNYHDYVVENENTVNYRSYLGGLR